MPKQRKGLRLGGWIVWTKGLSRKCEVLQIARRLGIDRRVAACLCMEVWEWADENTVNGDAAKVSPVEISALIGFDGIGEAMAEVGWIIEDAQGVLFPNWDRWNGASTKKRRLEAERKWQGRKEDAP